MTLRNKVEALLFASGKYLEEHDIANLLSESKTKVKKALKELKDYYENAENALDLMQAGDNWKMTVKEDYYPIVQNIVADTELETPVLETLAVIAWKRPVLQSEVVDIRGSGAYDHIKVLLDLEFITRERHGRTYKIKLAKKFFEYFDVEGDEDIRELFAEVERPEAPEPEVVEPEPVGEQVELPPMRKKEDAAEKRKKEREELENLDKEIETISKRADKHIEELDKFKDEEEEGDGEDTPSKSKDGTIAQED